MLANYDNSNLIFDIQINEYLQGFVIVFQRLGEVLFVHVNQTQVRVTSSLILPIIVCAVELTRFDQVLNALQTEKAEGGGGGGGGGGEEGGGHAKISKMSQI